MKTNKKILMLGISLVMVSIAVIGCISQSGTKQKNTETKPPIINLESFSTWGLTKDYPNSTSVSFSIYIENLNDEAIQLQLLYLYALDESGNLLFSFRPTVDINLDLYNQLHSGEFTLKAQENITLGSHRYIYKNSISENCWNYLNSDLNNVRISGLYKLNGELRWFESNLCEIGIIIGI